MSHFAHYEFMAMFMVVRVVMARLSEPGEGPEIEREKPLIY